MQKIIPDFIPGMQKNILMQRNFLLNENGILQSRILRLRRVAKRQIPFRRSAIHAERFLLYRKCNAISYKAKKHRKDHSFLCPENPFELFKPISTSPVPDKSHQRYQRLPSSSPDLPSGDRLHNIWSLQCGQPHPYPLLPYQMQRMRHPDEEHSCA